MVCLDYENCMKDEIEERCKKNRSNDWKRLQFLKELSLKEVSPLGVYGLADAYINIKYVHRELMNKVPQMTLEQCGRRDKQLNNISECLMNGKGLSKRCPNCRIYILYLELSAGTSDANVKKNPHN